MSNPRSFDLVLGGKILLPRDAAVLGGVEGLVKSLNMVYIPGGTFLMGSPEAEAGNYDDEKPQHQVTIQPFYMGKYSTTQALWKAVAQLPKIERDLKRDPSEFKGDNRPVENVSWYDAVEFCARLSQKTGRNYRLPSEAEWEYACRAGTTTPFHFGKTITTDLANYDGDCTYGNSRKGKYREETTSVGSFPPNAFGLYDMHGNVYEWCADPWHDDYNGAPTDGSVWDKKENAHRYQNSVDLLTKSRNDDRPRLLRGGSWLSNPRHSRSAIRNYIAPDTRLNHFGFRFVCVAEKPNPQISTTKTTNSTVCDDDYFESFVTDYYDE